MLSKDLEELCKAEGWWSRISSQKLKLRRFAQEFGYTTMRMLIKPLLWEGLSPEEQEFIRRPRKGDFSLKDLIPNSDECWILFAYKDKDYVKEESPLRGDGFILPLQWRSGEEVTKHDERLPLGLRELANKIKEQFQKDYESLKEKLELKKSPEEFYLYFSTSLFRLDQEVPIFSKEAREGKVRVEIESAWGALATGLYNAMSEKKRDMWPFSTMQYNFEKGEIESVAHIKEKLSVAASYEGAGFFVATKEQKKAAENKLKELQRENEVEIKNLKEKIRKGEREEALEKQIAALEEIKKSYEVIEVLCPEVKGTEKPLVIAADISDGYAKIRRKKIWRGASYGGLAAIIIMVVILGILAIDSAIPYNEYYVDYVDKWGKPVGISQEQTKDQFKWWIPVGILQKVGILQMLTGVQLAEDQIKHKFGHYRFEYKGKEELGIFGERVLRKVVYENENGIPIEHDLYDDRERPSILVLGYADDNQTVTQVKWRDSLNIPVMTYSITKKGVVEEVNITRYEMLNWAYTYTVSLDFFPYKEYCSGVDSYEIDRDENGFVSRKIAVSRSTPKEYKLREYFSGITGGDPDLYSRAYNTEYENEIEGYTYEYDTEGRITKVVYLQKNSTYSTTSRGETGKKYEYDEKTGELKSVKYVDRNGELRDNEYGWSEIAYEYNDEGPCKISIYNSQRKNSAWGEITDIRCTELNKGFTGYIHSAPSTYKKEYDEKKHLVRETYGYWMQYSEENIDRIIRKYKEKERLMFEFFARDSLYSEDTKVLVRKFDKKGDIEWIKKFCVPAYSFSFDFLESIDDLDEVEEFFYVDEESKVFTLEKDGICYKIKYDKNLKRSIAEVVSIKDEKTNEEDNIERKSEIEVESDHEEGSDSRGEFTEDEWRYTILSQNETTGTVSVRAASDAISGAINIPDSVEYNEILYSVTSIGDGAFWDCYNLTNITIPNSVTEIGFGAFTGCNSLTSITIPISVAKIEDVVFQNCDSLTNISVDPGNMSYCSEDGVLFDKDKTILIQYPAGKDEIKYTVLDNVTKIGDSAFRNCNNLTDISVNPGNMSYSSENGVLFNKDKSILIRYPGGKKEESYTIPDTVMKIEGSAFSECSGLKNIIIGNSVTEIGEWAFLGLPEVSSITISDSVTEIGCIDWINRSLTNIVVKSGNPLYSSENGVLFNKDKTILIQYPLGRKEESYTIPDSVVEIEMYTSWVGGYSNLKSITIGNSVSSIGEGLFSSCDSLTNISVNSDNLSYNSEDGVLFNKDKTILIRYPRGKKDSHYVIPDNVTTIGRTHSKGVKVWRV